MLVTKWLSIFSLVALVNLGLVSASVIHRLADGRDGVAVPDDGLLAAETVAVVKPDDAQSTEASPANLLQHIEAPQLNANAQPVDEDDPLMAEIRKHSALQFSEDLVLESESPIAVAEDATTNFHISKARLAAVRELGSATVALVDLAEQLQASGNADRSSTVMSQAERLQQMMVELLR